jgi:3-oxoacyl-[acyl-carrier-protein] synthase III
MTNNNRPHPRPAHPRRNVAIVGTGSYLPERILSNADLEKMVDTTDEWILSRTGISQRRIAADNEFTSDMAAAAARIAIKNAGIAPDDIDLVILATSTPDTIFPSTACRIQHAIGATGAASFDLQAACSGFLYGMIIAEQFIASHMHETVLVIGAEKLSSIVNWEDRNTCVLFGDGAGAVIMQAAPEGKHGILASDMGADGAQTDILHMPAGGCRMPVTADVLAQKQNTIHMSGKEVYRYAVGAMNASAERSLQLSGLTTDQLQWVIPHQANLRIINSVRERLGVEEGRVILNLNRYGNTSAACIPIALHENCQSGKIKPGDHILMVAFGGGLTWASIVLEW